MLETTNANNFQYVIGLKWTKYLWTKEEEEGGRTNCPWTKKCSPNIVNCDLPDLGTLKTILQLSF